MGLVYSREHDPDLPEMVHLGVLYSNPELVGHLARTFSVVYQIRLLQLSPEHPFSAANFSP